MKIQDLIKKIKKSENLESLITWINKNEHLFKQKPKTDMEKFIELYESFGIEVFVNDFEDFDNEICVELVGELEKGDVSSSSIGCTACYSKVYFTLKGKFVKQIFY